MDDRARAGGDAPSRTGRQHDETVEGATETAPAREGSGSSTAGDDHRHPFEALTDRQFEVVRVAFEAGHYEVPTEASVADVAEVLDLDPSTVAEHLQRAERNLLRHHFD